MSLTSVAETSLKQLFSSLLMSSALPQSTAPPSAAAGSSGAAQAAAFAEDPRVHFDRASGTWRLENDDGSELEYDSVKGVWVPVVDEELVKAQQAAYSVAGVDEEVCYTPAVTRPTNISADPCSPCPQAHEQETQGAGRLHV